MDGQTDIQTERQEDKEGDNQVIAMNVIEAFL